MNAVIQYGHKELCLDFSKFIDLSIPISQTDMEAFSIPKANISPLSIGSFIGDTRKGGSVNCEVVQFCAHGNATHTECVGHITKKRISICDILPSLPSHMMCLVISVVPDTMEQTSDIYKGKYSKQDKVISQKSLESSFSAYLQSTTSVPQALVVKTVFPTSSNRTTMNWSGTNPPYFTCSAMTYLRQLGINHLLVDLPSVDREDDGGIMDAHKTFFGLLDETDDHSLHTAKQRTITELCNAENALDGLYLLNLQIIGLSSDAAPCRPLIFPFQHKEISKQQ